MNTSNYQRAYTIALCGLTIAVAVSLVRFTQAASLRIENSPQVEGVLTFSFQAMELKFKTADAPRPAKP